MAVGQSDESTDFCLSLFEMEFFGQGDSLLTIIDGTDHVLVAVLPAEFFIEEYFIGIRS